MIVEAVGQMGLQQLGNKIDSSVEAMNFQELDGDQRRETINTQQRYVAWQRAKAELNRFKGSMVWNEDKGTEYLVRSDYDKKTGIRRQRSLGPRSSATERQKAQFKELTALPIELFQKALPLFRQEADGD